MNGTDCKTSLVLSLPYTVYVTCHVPQVFTFNDGIMS